MYTELIWLDFSFELKRTRLFTNLVNVFYLMPLGDNSLWLFKFDDDL